MRTSLYALILSSTLLSGAALGQETTNTSSYGVTLGGSYFVLPELGVGGVQVDGDALDNDVDGDGFGALFGLSGGFAIGKVGDFDAAIGISGFGMIGGSSSSSTQTFDGPGVVIVSGATTPDDATIGLTTASAPGSSTAGVTITHVNPEGGGESITESASTVLPGGINQYGVSPSADGNSFAYGALFTQQGDAETAGAFGAVAASDGGIFIGAGDLTGLEITTDVNRDVIYAGADISFSLSSQMEEMSVQAYFGPSYRFLSQDIDTTVSVDVPETAAAGGEFPTYAMTRDEQITSHYLGGVVGINFSKPISDTLTFTMGAEGGLYWAQDDYEGSEAYSVAGGSATPVPLTVVENGTEFDLDDDGLAWSVRLSPSVTKAISPNQQITFGLGVDYLSRVASVEHSNPVTLTADSYSGTDDGSLTYDTPSTGTTTLTHSAMWSFTPTISFTGQF